LHKLRKERKKSPRGCFECDNITHFIVDCPKRKKLDSSNKYDCFGDKKKEFQKMISRACAALNDLDFSSDDSFSSDEDEKLKCKPDDFTGLCLMGKSSSHICDSNVSDDLSPKGLSLRVVEHENALYDKDKLLCKIF
jgi:hypothetical protein